MNSLIANQKIENKSPQIIDKFYFQWHITDKCNLRCTHCYQENYTAVSDKPLEELKVIANKLLHPEGGGHEI